MEEETQIHEAMSASVLSETDQLMLKAGSLRPLHTHSSVRGRSCSPGALHRRLRRRAVLKNGDKNVVQFHVSKKNRKYLQDLFTTMVDVQWRYSLIVFSMSFLLSWFGFGCVWWLIVITHGDLDPDRPDDWVPCVVNIEGFWSCFLFSVETQSTIGFGGRATTEECPEAMVVMCVQSIVGMVIQAFMVGFVFAKMARPKQRTQTLLFSRYAVISQRDGRLCLMFRVGDIRDKSHLIGVSLRVHLLRHYVTKEGELISPYLHKLEVQADDYDSELVMIWPMTVVHRIDEHSPLYRMSAADLMHDRFEIVVVMEGTTESTGQTSQARTSYLPSEVLWGHRFQPMVSYSKERMSYLIDYSLFHRTQQVDTPLCSAHDTVETHH
ncbi:ATP-sensitive inward rectifier potassium channel 12-like [Macrosteles quadrilineatus]|uniref:ATP-sensitive inward rectifier potassium channel 12-like n=1 Tax=Macrosteles quadrilineatus TaxID=74068 RepID=UPI0023E09F03|nr:ATP-sensitive inward rectifier potassium channel 12-like [Macrosteles quadrilineatus]